MKNIIFYHTQTCPQCKMVEMLLKKNQINYDSVEDTDLMIEKGIQKTPALGVNEEVFYGKDIINWINEQR